MSIKMVRDRHDPDLTTGNCEVCGSLITRYRGEGGDLICPTPDCPAIYNIFGQRLRDDLYTHRNPSDYDDDIGDLEGYEMAMVRADLEGPFDD